MLDLRVEVDLVRVAAVLQEDLGLVAALGGEDLVRLGGGDGHRALEALELLLVDERRMGHVADRDGGVVTGDVLRGKKNPPMSVRGVSEQVCYEREVSCTYLGAKAVTGGAQLLDTLLLLEVLDGLLDDGVDMLFGVGVVAGAALGEPGHEVKVGGAVEVERVPVEDVDDEGQVAVGGELVGHQLAVLPDADDVGDVQDAGILVRLLALGHGQVAGVLADLDVLSGGRASVVLVSVMASQVGGSTSRAKIMSC